MTEDPEICLQGSNHPLDFIELINDDRDNFDLHYGDLEIVHHLEKKEERRRRRRRRRRRPRYFNTSILAAISKVLKDSILEIWRLGENSVIILDSAFSEGIVDKFLEYISGSSQAGGGGGVFCEDKESLDELQTLLDQLGIGMIIREKENQDEPIIKDVTQNSLLKATSPTTLTTTNSEVDILDYQESSRDDSTFLDPTEADDEEQQEKYLKIEYDEDEDDLEDDLEDEIEDDLDNDEEDLIDLGSEVSFASSRSKTSIVNIDEDDDDDDDPKIIFSCEICDKSYGTKRHLRRHVKDKHPDDYVPWKYPWKNSSTASNNSRKRSSTESGMNQDDDLESAGLKYVATMIDLFYKHSDVTDLITEGVRSEINLIDNKIMSYYTSPIPIPDGNDNMTKSRKCYICGLSMNNYFTLIDHVRNKHSKENNPWSCKWCGFKSSSTQQFRRHITWHKPLIDPIKCKSCSDNCYFFNFIDYDDHKKEIHHSAAKETIDSSNTNDSSYFCSRCGRNFDTETKFKRHNAHYHPKVENIFSCNKCDFKSRLKSSLKHHILLHAPPTNQCPFCVEMFHATSYLNKHIKNKHTNDADKSHKCQHCGKGFTSNTSLKTHMISHTDSKPFTCRFCPASYNNQSNTRKHERKKHSEFYTFKKENRKSTHKEKMIKNQIS